MGSLVWNMCCLLWIKCCGRIHVTLYTLRELCGLAQSTTMGRPQHRGHCTQAHTAEILARLALPAGRLDGGRKAKDS